MLEINLLCKERGYMEYKKLARFLEKEIKQYNQCIYSSDINAICMADMRLNTIREIVDQLEDGTSIAITWKVDDFLEPDKYPVRYIKQCSVEYMDIWGKRHVEHCKIGDKL